MHLKLLTRILLISQDFITTSPLLFALFHKDNRKYYVLHNVNQIPKLNLIKCCTKTFPISDQKENMSDPYSTQKVMEIP